MILVTVGTHEQPFDRLVEAAERLAASERVVLQKGTSHVATPRCDAAPFLGPQALWDAMQQARVVICHGGPSTIFEAAAAGHVAVVVPRRADRGEHVDDHQVRFARHIADRVYVVEDLDELEQVVAAVAAGHAEQGGVDPNGQARAEAFCQALESLCQGLVTQGPARRSLRARFRTLSCWMSPRS